MCTHALGHSSPHSEITANTVGYISISVKHAIVIDDWNAAGYSNWGWILKLRLDILTLTSLCSNTKNNTVKSFFEINSIGGCFSISMLLIFEQIKIENCHVQWPWRRGVSMQSAKQPMIYIMQHNIKLSWNANCTL